MCARVASLISYQKLSWFPLLWQITDVSLCWFFFCFPWFIFWCHSTEEEQSVQPLHSISITLPLLWVWQALRLGSLCAFLVYFLNLRLPVCLPGSSPRVCLLICLYPWLPVWVLACQEFSTQIFIKKVFRMLTIKNYHDALLPGVWEKSLKNSTLPGCLSLAGSVQRMVSLGQWSESDFH